jgi:hypothetical protein
MEAQPLKARLQRLGNFAGSGRANVGAGPDGDAAGESSFGFNVDMSLVIGSEGQAPADSYHGVCVDRRMMDHTPPDSRIPPACATPIAGEEYVPEGWNPLSTEQSP